ncbi:site-specific DNA-methyltransferase [Nonomuraea roseoviolacea]|uniref:Adenine-specific DNA-methyltransferase n=1 Tax=Nonomuraea roseoviolacea subsp. carminata TaxID=160689 RepID=A0ABT1K2B2_9ACTN|nr:DNA methyltransferase [Nonomuraea roseoviolacea]MCP2348135.1 adenine-specific DNA-methyltransferase [Nonomuraea roseoviolacea subsp. carminata]
MTDLIRQAKRVDPQLGADLEAEVQTLSRRRPFGINFERHQPEAVELPKRSVRKGDKVRILPARGETKQGDVRLWRVRSVETVDGAKVGHLDLIGAKEPENRTVSADDLVVVAEFRDPIYPGLRSTGALHLSDGQPWHAVINGENFHALEMLLYTHQERIDCIYIDPPYNTGQDEWIYNDRHVDGEDLYRHSKWLAFMERRLILARELLKDTGIIIVAIGDDQHHRLRMLMDQVFHEQNFISDVVWQGGRKNDSRYISNGADYMLIYAKDESTLRRNGVRWREPRPGTAEIASAAARVWEESGHDQEKATVLMKEWIRSLPKNHPAKENNRFYEFEPDGRVFRKRDISWPGGGGPRYDVLHPVTGLPVLVPARGWVYSKPERMQEDIDAGLIMWGADHTEYINRKTYLGSDASDDSEDSGDNDPGIGMVPTSVFEQKRTSASKRMKSLFGDSRFPFPKDHTVLARWIGLVSPKDGVILDFFGGSGTTMEAVIRLNAQDSGSRQCILVTNNEVGAKETRAMRKAGLRRGDVEWEAKGVFEYVTKPRISTVVTGVKPDGSAYGDKVDANVEFFEMTYESVWRITQNREFKAIAPLLWLRAGAKGRRIDAVPQGWDVADTYGVLQDLDKSAVFLQAMADTPSTHLAFIVTDDDRRFQMICAELPDRVEPVRLYESYLKNFEINAGAQL